MPTAGSILMISKYMIIGVVGVVLLLSLLYIMARIYISQSDAIRNAFFGGILNNINNNFILATTTTITNSMNKSDMTAKDSTDELKHRFEQSFEKLVNDLRSLSLSYQDEIGKWQLHQYDNASMISITNDYLQKFQNTIETAQELKPSSDGYKMALNPYIKSIQSEIGSHIYFRNYLSTGNPKQDERSIQLLSDAFNYEKQAFDAFKSTANQ